MKFRLRQCQRIANGGFGTVYLCVDQDTGKKIAMKSVEAGANNTSTSKAVEALQLEIQLCKTLKHERIVIIMALYIIATLFRYSWNIWKMVQFMT